MRVAIFTDNDFRKVNGVTTTLRAVLAHTPADLDVRVYTSSQTAVEEPGYVALASPGIGIPFYREMTLHWPRVRAFARRVRQTGVDVVHYTTPGPMGLVAQYIAWSTGVPMVGSFHTQLAEYTELLSGSPLLGSAVRQYMRWPYGQCARVLVPSEDTRRMLIDTGLAPERIHLWARGADTDRFSPTRRSTALRAQWGAADSDVVMLFVGRLSREKGLDLLAAALQRLRALNVRVRPVFVGDGPFRSALASQCPDAVFTGTLSPDGVAAAMASADVFAFPSATETAGNVVLEAQASGLPVVVCDRGGAPEQMLPGATGLMVRTGRADELADAMTRLACDAALRATLGRAGRHLARERSWARALHVLFDSYRRVAADHAAATARPVHARATA